MTVAGILFFLSACQAKELVLEVDEKEIQNAQSGAEELIKFEVVFESFGDFDTAQKTQIEALENIVN